MCGGQTVTWTTAGYGKLLLEVWFKMIEYLELNALQGGTDEVFCAQYVNAIGPLYSCSAPIYAQTT